MTAGYTISSVGVRGSIPIGFRHFGTPAGLMIARAILAGRTYPIVPFVRDVSTVFDVGANLGAASLFFAHLYPTATIYAFEPAAASFELLCENTADRPKIRAFRHGLASSTRIATLFHCAHDSVEASVHHSARSSRDSEPIDLQATATFLERQRVTSIDVLKLDAEGAELEVLGALGSVARAAKIVYVEYHSERDRFSIDETMIGTHVLWRASVERVHRGEFCYLRRDLVPADVSDLTPELLPE